MPARRSGLHQGRREHQLQPFQRWQNRFEFVAEAIKLSEQETGERKGHYLNVTANTPEEMYERAEFAKELGMPIIMHDFITGGFTANTGLSKWCRKNGMLLHIHRAMHAVIDRHLKHGIHFRVLAKCLRLSGGDQLHTGTVVGKLEGDRQTTLGYIDQLRESFVPEDRSRGNFFDQDWGSMPGVPAVASGGIHVWHMPALVTIFGDDSVLQFGGGTTVTPGVPLQVLLPTVWPSRPASRHATPAVISRKRAATSSRKPRSTAPSWPSPSRPGRRSSSSSTPSTSSTFRTDRFIGRPMQPATTVLTNQDPMPFQSTVGDYQTVATLETFGFLLPMTQDEIYDQIAYIIAQGWSPLVEHVHPSNSMATYWSYWKLPSSVRRI